MKKHILAIALTLITISSQSALAGGVAIVDTKKILDSSQLPAALNTAQKEVENFKVESQKLRLSKSKDLEAAREKKATDADLKKMAEKFQKELEDRERQGADLEVKKRKELEDLSLKLRAKVDEAIKSVAQDKKLDVVVDKQAVLFGGTDITEDVIKKIK